ncbi:hypothetical protein TNCV_2687371 [Trichonephila clavipes]|nr:hypothetical protein TNCV_2687371 [Trichonephila clavipes]
MRCWLNEGNSVNTKGYNKEKTVAANRRAQGYSTNTMSDDVFDVRSVTRYELTCGTSMFLIHKCLHTVYGAANAGNSSGKRFVEGPSGYSPFLPGPPQREIASQSFRRNKEMLNREDLTFLQQSIMTPVKLISLKRVTQFEQKTVEKRKPGGNEKETKECNICSGKPFVPIQVYVKLWIAGMI